MDSNRLGQGAEVLYERISNVLLRRSLLSFTASSREKTRSKRPGWVSCYYVIVVVDISHILLSMLINVKKMQALNIFVFRCKPVKRKLEVNEWMKKHKPVKVKVKVKWEWACQQEQSWVIKPIWSHQYWITIKYQVNKTSIKLSNS